MNSMAYLDGSLILQIRTRLDIEKKYETSMNLAPTFVSFLYSELVSSIGSFFDFTSWKILEILPLNYNKIVRAVQIDGSD
ncbi:hypothetical protein AC249_AIPGENE14802 [Exaiptasia diaphana]|nr:hypothetical protein AC249_AIPGENE14802 [Exaiptasia diaphana]